MNLRRITSRAAVAGVTTALAAGALVGATGTAANAVEASTDYTCALTSPAQVPLGDFNMAVSTPVIPATATAGQSFPGDLLALTAVLTIPADSAGPLVTYGVDHGDISNYTVKLGSTSIKADLAFDAPVVQGDGSATMTGGGSNKPFTLPKAGTYKAALPKAFTFTTTVDLGAGPTDAAIGCTTTAPGNLGTVKVTKGVSSLKAKAAKKGKINVTVTRVGDDVVPAGKVTAKVGKKSWTATLKKGKAVLSLGSKYKGKKATVSYKGDSYTAAAKSVTVTVKK